MTLYLKYRPQTIDELDLTSVRETLAKIVTNANLPHAFLFSGSKGTGKTSAARILAKVINCESTSQKLRGSNLSEPCNQCDTCLAISKGNHIDVVEMDAASHRGIDDMRALKETIALSPQSAKKKIYIIDEAHMLTTEAANAFLKTLEEPPPHVIFVLATTNPEKLPDTIQSRLTTINFPKATAEEVKRQLKRVIAGENFKVDGAAIQFIAQACDGSFRDAVKLLEQLASQYDQITSEVAQEFLFQAKTLQIDSLIQKLEAKEKEVIIVEIERVATQGGSMKLYIDQLMLKLHGMILNLVNGQGNKTKIPLSELVALLSHLQVAKQALPTAFIPQLPLELELLKWLNKTAPQRQEEPAPKKEVTNKIITKANEAKKEVGQKVAEVISDINQESWAKLLANIKSKNASIEALLRAAKPVNLEGNTLTLAVYYQFHKERLEAGANRKTFEEIATVVFGIPIRLECKLTPKPQVQAKPKETVLTDATDTDIIKAAKEIFGS